MRVFFFFFLFFFFNDTATTEIYTLSLHDALPIFKGMAARMLSDNEVAERIGNYKFGEAESIDLLIWRSEEHTSELQSRETISYAVFCLKKKIILNSGLSSFFYSPLW